MMRVPIDWLHEYCRPNLDTAALADRLAMTGTNVEAIHRHGVGALDHFVVGHVLERRKHPDADRLSVCIVDTGDGAPSQIVCGAPNVAAGQTVAVARPGAVMPDGTKLGKARLRGIESDGMILAEDELAIGTEHAGILELELDGVAPGTPLADLVEISTDVLELEITSNRPDCLGVYGVARELHAATGAPLASPPWTDDPGSEGTVEGVTIDVECPDLCPRFTARVFEDVRIAPSPPWLKARLMAAGQRPISNVVDITNYTMLLTGQPLHAFDLDRVAGERLVVRRARDREQVQTLDGQTRTLDAEMVVIDDDDGPTSIAGVMGGARSEVDEGTSRVLMEVANWDGPNIHRTSLRLGLRSEASGRFEKQLQPEQTIEAQAVAAQLMIELCGARLVPGRSTSAVPGRRRRRSACATRGSTGLLGMSIPRERSREILGALEFTTADAPDGLDVTVPAFRRADVTREADVIEEVARLDGLEKLPATLPSRKGASGRLNGRQRLRRRASDALAAQGLDEIVGWSFAHPELADRLRLRLGHDHPDRRAREPDLGRSLAAAHDGDRLAARRRAPQPRSRRRHAPPVRGGRGVPADRARAARSATSPTTSARCWFRAPVRPPSWREPQPRAVDFFAAKGGAPGPARSFEGGLATRARERAVPASRRASDDPRRRRAGRLGGGDPPARGRGVGARPAGRGRLRARSRRRPGVRPSRCTVTSRASPTSARISRLSWPRTSPPPRWSKWCAGAVARCWPEQRSLTSIETPSGWARGRCRWRSGSPSARPTGR